MDYSRPNPWWIVAFLVAAVFGIAAYATHGWLRWMFGAIAFISGTYGSVQFGFWMTDSIAAAIDSVSTAKVAGAVALAYAIKDLNNRQLELVAAHDISVIDIEAGLTGPAYYIVGIKYQRIPYDFGVEFMEAARDTYPYLLAIRNSKHEDWATDLTNKIVMLGMAEPANGNRPAKLIKPLETVAYQFGIVME